MLRDERHCDGYNDHIYHYHDIRNAHYISVACSGRLPYTLNCWYIYNALVTAACMKVSCNLVPGQHEQNTFILQTLVLLN